jgi:hypothetical protein
MQLDERHKPTISLTTGETGHCVRDAATRQFMCSVNHPVQTSLAASQSMGSKSSSSSKMSSAQVGIVIASVAVLCIVAVMAVKAVNDNEKKVTRSAVAYANA